MSQQTSEQRVAKVFGLEGDKWMRHANPTSVWTRFATLPVLAVAIWSYDWIGWWSLAPTGLVLLFLMINPLLFREPSSTRNWLIRLDVIAVVSGLLLAQVAKCWYLDRMVLLFEEMKNHSPEYATWEY